MTNDCCIKNWFKNKSWLPFLFWLSIIWLVGIIVIAWFPSTGFNKYLTEKIGGSTSTSDAINFGVALGTVILAIVGWIAYKEYWKQKKDATIYDRIIRSTSLMHTRILQFQRFIDNYAQNATLHLNGDVPTRIPVVWLNDLIHDTNACLSGIKDFESVISEWETELDYIHLFTKSINKELITSKLEEQFRDLKKDLYNLFSQISKIKNRLLEYSKKAQQSSLSKIPLKVNPVVIKNLSIQETKAAIKDFIKQTIDTFS